jgi:hypothetical protein
MAARKLAKLRQTRCGLVVVVDVDHHAADRPAAGNAEGVGVVAVGDRQVTEIDHVTGGREGTGVVLGILQRADGHLSSGNLHAVANAVEDANVLGQGYLPALFERLYPGSPSAFAGRNADVIEEALESAHGVSRGGYLCFSLLC